LGGIPTAWNRTKIALQISSSVNPLKAAPVTVNEALSPGAKPSPTVPPVKEGPVVKPKSSTTEFKPAGTFPKSASENVKVEPRLGACDPVKPLRPLALALPVGGKSNPIPVIVDVDPGVVMADVFVTVNVKVFVWELNSHTTVAVARFPVCTPTMVMVSALTDVALHTIKAKIANGKLRRNLWWDIRTLSLI
jgi:hypothetical protein